MAHRTADGGTAPPVQMPKKNAGQAVQGTSRRAEPCGAYGLFVEGAVPGARDAMEHDTQRVSGYEAEW